MADYCPCGKTKSFEQCCGRFIRGGENAKTPEQLMRSRYSAYALGGCGEYLLKTWFPLTAKGVTAEELSQKQLDWQRLELLNRSQSGDEGAVEFKAYYYIGERDAGERGSGETDTGESDGRTLQVMHEYSEFKRIKGRWYYIGGRVVDEEE